MTNTNDNAIVKVEIDLNGKLPSRYVGSDEDGPVYQEQTLNEAIVADCARLLLNDAEKTLRTTVAELVEAKVAELIDAELPAIFTAALNEEMEVRDEWGNVQRHKSMRQTIAERVKSQARANGRDGYNRTALDEVIRTEVDHSLKDIFTAEVEAAKKEIRDRLKAKAAELLAAESLRDAGVR